MKPQFIAVTLLSIALVVALAQVTPVNSAVPASESPVDQSSAAYARGEILIKLRPGVTLTSADQTLRANRTTLTAVLAQLGARSAMPVFAATASADLQQVYRLKTPADVMFAVKVLTADPNVEYAEPNYLARAVAVPNDPLYGSQWALAKINAPAAWDVITGTPGVVIALIDSGVDTTQPDLVGRLWINPGEIAGNSLDDDNNGYLDDVNGWNFVGSNNHIADDNGHGTQVAGVAGAATDNAVGIAGLCWNCRLMIVKAMQASGVANYSDIAAGVEYAASKGAQVINLSLGGYADSATLRAAIEAASSTAVIVGGAGNDNVATPFYPAAYSNVLAVASTTISDTKAIFSDYGSWVDVAAPGVAISTTFAGGDYGTSDGTSLSAPLVSGLAGLIRSLHSDWSPALIRAQIIHTTEAITETQLGSGRINAQQATTTDPTPLLSLISYAVNGVSGGMPAPGSSANLSVTIQNEWGPANSTIGTLSTGDPYVTVTSASAAYGDIDAYHLSANAPPFVVSISAAVPYAHAIALSLTITATGGVTVVVPLTVTTQSGTQAVSGVLVSDTVWMSDKTYHVLDNVLVSSGVTLTIQPGTVIKFAADKSLLVAGTLIAAGSASQPIVFTSDQANPAPGDWHLIKFAETAVDAAVGANNDYLSGSLIQYAWIEYADGMALMEALPYISHATFYRNTGTNEGEVYWFYAPGALWRRGSSGRTGILVVRDSVFLENQGAGFETSQNGAQTIVTGNQFLNNGGPGIIYNSIDSPIDITSNLISGNGGGIALETMGYATEHILIENNVILSSTKGAYFPGYGVSMDSSSPMIRHNLFANHDSIGDGCQGSCSVIFAHDGSAPTVISNTFIGNRIGTLICFNCLYGYNSLLAPGIYQHNNWDGNTVDYIVQRGASSNHDITATANYWGTVDPTQIGQLIFDYYDDLAPGKVLFQPVLDSPEPTAPAYLRLAEIAPDPVGIESATFTLTFSAPMDQGFNPLVTFEAASSATRYTVLDNAHWINDRTWQATYDISSLVPRGTYTLGVSGARGSDAMDILPDARFSFAVDYAGSITDQTPPPTPTLWVDLCRNSTTSVAANWSASDPNSAITLYRYALGSSANGVDAVNWTNTGSTFVTRSGLNLVAGQRYYFSVKARNAGGLWSQATSRGFTAGVPCRRIYLPLVRK